jgi:Zn-dependent peptidase ImmA (M78 family)
MINWKKYYKNIPSQIKIGKSVYQVLWINDFPGDIDQLGETRFQNTKQIIINTNQPIKEAVHTFFHEMLHALSFEYNADLTERQVRNLEKGLKDLINVSVNINGKSKKTKKKY